MNRPTRSRPPTPLILGAGFAGLGAAITVYTGNVSVPFGALFAAVLVLVVYGVFFK